MPEAAATDPRRAVAASGAAGSIMGSTEPRILITGGFGFLGWHTACQLIAKHGMHPVRAGRDVMRDPALLDRVLAAVDAVIHVAGTNRAASEDEVETGNIEVAEALAAGLQRRGQPLHVTYANSIQAGNSSGYGRGKEAAAALLRSATNGNFADILLPNLFGEHGRPGYNSFVATFADAIAQGREPVITQDRDVSLLHVQRAAARLIEAALQRHIGQSSPSGESCRVVEVRERLKAIHELYAQGDVPPLHTGFDVDLFNTYRSHQFPQLFPKVPQVHSDPRGSLFEAVRSHGGTGQAFMSSTRPGQTRGNHYHLHKFERFLVVRGRAEIALRRLFGTEVVRFYVTGDRPSYVDMPTLWVHNIRNVGDEELLTLFWSDQLLDPQRPDQYPEQVEVSAAGDVNHNH